MKKYLIAVFICTFIIGLKAQTINCSSFCVTEIAIDTLNDELDVTIVNGDTNNVNYPIVIVTDLAGDTIANINQLFYFFAHLAGDTVVHSISTTLTSLSGTFNGTVYITDALFNTTCFFAVPMTCSLVGVNEMVSNASLNVYPNPSADEINVQLSGFNAGNSFLVSVYDITGRELNHYQSTTSLITIKKENLDAGIYFVRVAYEGKYYSKKIIFN
ncbi:MAG: T9SS type A sorting domain-containing protein [Bacteroidia bacterium]|nr:T9SS type A sorting domain-containing protein [Bacteroidia bacterium]